jgi:nucleotide-binding universal stress UspA family protein
MAGFCVQDVHFPTDLSPEAEGALEHARLLCQRFGARLTLYHAVEVPDPRYPHWAFAHGHEVWCQAVRAADSALRGRAAQLGLEASVVVERTTSAHQAVVQRVKHTRPDLTVMATHGRGGLSHVLLGSVTEKVLQQIHHPLLCVRAIEGDLPQLYRRILVPTDLSLASRFAFPLAARLAEALGAEVIGLHVTPGATLGALTGVADSPPVVIPSEAYLWKFFQTDFATVPVNAQIHQGPVWERIVHVARTERADLIVMSTRGHDSLADRILGSNTERVVRHAPCPVLVA